MVKRVYEIDPLVCRKCGSEMKIIAFIIDHSVVDKILRHLKRREEERRGRATARAIRASIGVVSSSYGSKSLVLVEVCPE